VSTGATDTAAPGFAPAVLSSVSSLSDPGRGFVLGSGGGTAAFAVAGGRIVSIRGRIDATAGAAGGGVGLTIGRRVGTGRPPSGGGGRDDFFAGTWATAADAMSVAFPS